MLAALQTGVKGDKWHSLIDKVSRPETLGLGWIQVERNAGAAGVDRMSVERFAQGRDCYLAELAQALRDGSYRPQPVRRVYIPKGKGQRPLGIPAVKDRVVAPVKKAVGYWHRDGRFRACWQIFFLCVLPVSCLGSTHAAASRRG